MADDNLQSQVTAQVDAKLAETKSWISTHASSALAIIAGLAAIVLISWLTFG